METAAIHSFAAPTRMDARRSVVDSRYVHYRCSVNTAEGKATKLGLASLVTVKSVNFIAVVLTVHGLKRNFPKSECETDADVFNPFPSYVEPRPTV
jgi:hypothetical protein